MIAVPGELEACQARVRSAVETLKLAIGNARTELRGIGAISDEAWELTERLAVQLEERLGELEQAERAAGLR